MPRMNLDGTWCGASERLTVRLSQRDWSALQTLAAAWGTDSSGAMRRAVRQAYATRRKQELEAQLTALPTMTCKDLRAQAGRLHLPGRSRMSKAELYDALSRRLERALKALD